MKTDFWQLYSAFFDALPQCILARREGKISYANSAARALLEAETEASLLALIDGAPQSADATLFPIKAGETEYTVFLFPIEDTTGIILAPARTVDSSDVSPLISAIGNQFRMPLTMMFSAVSLLYSVGDIQRGSKTDQYLSVIAHNCHRLLRLSNNISGIADIHSLRAAFFPEPANLVSFVRGLVTKTQPFADMLGVTMNFSCAEQAIDAVIDKDKLERALLNLIANALRSAPRDSCVEIRAATNEKQIFLSVTDHGPGIPARQLPYIFNRVGFFPLPGEDAKTLGLGLPIVKEIAEMHGGALALVSREETGTAVTLSLPFSGQDHYCVNTPVLEFDYAGGFSHILLELSDILPYEVFSRSLRERKPDTGPDGH